MPRLPAAVVVVLAAAALGGCGGSKSAEPAPATPAATAVAYAGSTVTPASLPFSATLAALTHTPKVNATWRYTVRVTDRAGAPISARITVQIVDPLGRPHPVEYDDTTEKIVDWPVTGVFRDFVLYPADARGVPLRFQVIVRAQGRVARLTYVVTAR